MKVRSLLLWCALLLPIIAFTGLVLRAELGRAAGPVFQLPIAGYDPRHLLKGQYLRYRLQWPADSSCDSPMCCLCLRTSGAHARVTCAASDATCAAQLSHEVVERGYEFFIQEDAGPALEEAIRRGQGSIALNVTSDGQLHVHDLFIDGVRHRRWLREQAPR